MSDQSAGTFFVDDGSVPPHLKRRLRLGMVGGGRGSFIAEVHALGARISNRYEVVAGALSSDPELAKQSGADWYFEPDRTYTSYRDMATAEAARPDGVDAVAITPPNHLTSRLLRRLPRSRDRRHLRQAACDHARGRARSCPPRQADGAGLCRDLCLRLLSHGAPGEGDDRGGRDRQCAPSSHRVLRRVVHRGPLPRPTNRRRGAATPRARARPSALPTSAPMRITSGATSRGWR